MKRFHAPTELRTRLAIVLGLIVAVTLCLASVFCYFAIRSSLRGDADTILREQSMFLRRIKPSQFPKVKIQAAVDAASKRRSDSVWQMLRADGTPYVPTNATGNQLAVSSADRRLAAGATTRVNYTDQTLNGRHMRVITVPVSLPGIAAAQIARPLDDVDGALHELIWVLLSITIFGSLLAAGAARILTKPVLAPTEEALAGSLAAQRQLVADASHELRTPITSLHTNAELLADHDELAPETRRDIAKELVQQSSQLATLVTDLLDLARDDEATPHELARFDEIVADAVDEARRVWPGIDFATDLTPCSVICSRPAVFRAVRNLLDNAAIHGAPVDGSPSRIDVRLTRDGELSVRDRGAGIAPDEMPFVFDRFRRGEASRGRPGSGLGLAIVKQTAEAHHGAASLGPSPDGRGAIATFTLPVSTVTAPKKYARSFRHD